jgi:hypothetical protein
MANSVWTTPTPTTPRNTIAQTPVNDADGRTPAQRLVDQQWRNVVKGNVHKEHPDSLNQTAPGEDA